MPSELGQLETLALKKEASSLELYPAHFALESFTSLGGPQHCTAGAQGGVLSEEAFPAYQLDLTKLDARTLGLKLASFLVKGASCFPAA